MKTARHLFAVVLAAMPLSVPLQAQESSSLKQDYSKQSKESEEAAQDPKARPLADVASVSEEQPYGPLGLDCSNGGRGIKIKDRSFQRGLGTHANSRIVYGLGGKVSRFEAWVGVDAEMAGYAESSVIFRVLGDGKTIFDSGVMKVDSPAKRVSVDLKGVAELALVVTDAGDGNICDHANWADAVLIADEPLPSRPLPPDAVELNANGVFGSAKVVCKGKEMTVTTGMLERRWRWTGKGLVTVGLRDLASGREFAVSESRACDWDMPGVLNDSSKAILIGSSAAIRDDDGFTNKHLEVITTLRYEKANLEIQHVVWAFPGAPGVRTQLRVKAMPGFKPEASGFDDSTFNNSGGTIARAGARCEYLPLDFSAKNTRTYWGMYNDPGNRLDQSKPMLKEDRISGWPIFQDESVNWASGEAVDYSGAGVAVIKESHKAVNNQGHHTGSFFSGPSGLRVTGWGLAPQEFVADRFRECWATWTVVYQNGNDGLQLALKRFNLARYPVFPKRDALLIHNTWGPGNPDGGVFSTEVNCLLDIPPLADLGIEVLQIDAGWHNGAWWANTDFSMFDPHRFPNGIKPVKDACDKNNLKLGLWFHARNAKEADLLKSTGDLHVASWKLDFEHIGSRADLENRFAQLRRMMKADWMKTQFTLCPEYEDPRFGWYFAQEYGSIYFQNNQEALPTHLTAVPYQVLRQHWLMAKYFPLNKLQVMMQNPKRMDASRSDGPLHGHGYSFATGLACGAPVFFQMAEVDPGNRAGG